VFNAAMRPLSPTGIIHGTHFKGDWLGPRSYLDVCGKSLPHRDLIPGLSSP